MVNRGKVLGHIALEHVGVRAQATHELKQAVHGLDRALARGNGVAVVDELPLKVRPDHPADGVVDHPVPEEGRANKSPLDL